MGFLSCRSCAVPMALAIAFSSACRPEARAVAPNASEDEAQPATGVPADAPAPASEAIAFAQLSVVEVGRGVDFILEVADLFPGARPGLERTAGGLLDTLDRDRPTTALGLWYEGEFAPVGVVPVEDRSGLFADLERRGIRPEELERDLWSVGKLFLHERGDSLLIATSPAHLHAAPDPSPLTGGPTELLRAKVDFEAIPDAVVGRDPGVA